MIKIRFRLVAAVVLLALGLPLGAAALPARAADIPTSPQVPVDTTYVHLPMVSTYPPPQYVGAFIPLVDLKTWDSEARAFEAMAQKSHGVYLISSGFDCPWARHVYQLSGQLTTIAQLEAMPLITWVPMNCEENNPHVLGLPDIIEGKWDAYIQKWATDISALGYPVFVRWGHEMNIPSYSWAGQHAFGANGRTDYNQITDACGFSGCFGDTNVPDGPERYIEAYRRVHRIADPLAPNIVWVWNPNARNWPLPDVAPWNHYNNYYPGDAYVDWVGLDGYNWGDQSGNGYGRWVTFNEMFGAELVDLAVRYPGKRQMIPEVGAVEDPRKPDFIRDVYRTGFTQFPKLQIIIWVQDNGFWDPLHYPPAFADFRVNSSDAALQAYREAVAPWAGITPPHP